MRAIMRRIRAARRRRAVERTLAGLNRRGVWTHTIRQDGEYQRVYMEYLGGLIALSPRTAERYLDGMVDREFRRALAR